MAVIANVMGGAKLTADDFLKTKRKRKVDNDAAAQRFFAPLVAAGIVKEEPLSNAGSN